MPILAECPWCHKKQSFRNRKHYQQQRTEAGRAAATIDMELSIAKTMINRAFF